jgi:uncharacterized protein (DUF736 family)
MDWDRFGGRAGNAVAAETVLGPCVLSVQDHTQSGLVFVVNPGEGTAALHFVSRRLGLLRRNRPARQISPTCGLPREANFSFLPVLHCVAAPSLRCGMRRARTLNVKVKIVPNDKESENAPDYRIVAGNFEIGAAWKKMSRQDRPYLSVTLDDPSFPATIYARLVEGEDGAHNLIWSRSKGD